MAESTTWMLCLDASAPRTCVALGRVATGAQGGEHELAVADARQDRANQVSAGLQARLEGALREAGVEPRQLGAIACARGPGTFTGSRVAVATAKGLALGLSIPVVPLSSLASLAASAPRDGQILALLDARREQVYGAAFEVGEEILARSEERVTELGALLSELRRDAPELVDTLQPFGPGCGPYAEQLPKLLRERGGLAPGPTPVGLWRAAVSALRSGAAVDAGAFTVSYLRQSYAQMGINKPKRPVFKSPFVD